MVTWELMGKVGHPVFRRRRFFIKKGLQGRFVLGFSLCVLLGFVLNLALAYFLIDRELAAGLYKIHLKVRTTSEIASPVLWKLGVVTVPAVLAVCTLVGYYLTRGVELPLRSFRESVVRLSRGELKHRVSGDMPEQELIDTFNSMAGSLAESFRSIRTSVEGVEASMARLDANLGKNKPSTEELRRILDDLAEARRGAWVEISKFKV